MPGSARRAIVIVSALVAGGLGLPGAVATAAPPALQSAPAIAAVTPTAAHRAESVTITGRGFGRGTEVTIAGVAAEVTDRTGSRLVLRVPGSAAVGETVVEVRHPNGRPARAAFEVLGEPGAWTGRAILSDDPARAITKRIGAAGGSVTADGSTLTVPAGALLTETDITLTPLTALSGTPVDDSLVSGVRMQPDGLVFLQPATLTVLRREAIAVTGFGTDNDGSRFHLVPVTVNGDVITIPIWHFSAAGAIAPDATELATVLQYEPTSAQEAAVQAVAAAALAGDSEGMVTAMRTWFYTSVRPGLESAVGASQEFFELAVGEWLAGWRNVASQHGLLDDLKPQDDYAQSLTMFAAADLAGRMLSRCSPSLPFADALADLARLATVLGLDTIDFPLETRSYNGRQLPSSDGLLEACVSVEVESVERPAVLARAIDNPLTVRAATVFWNGGAVYDRPLRFELVNIGTMTEQVEDSALVDDGVWETGVSPGEETTYGRVVRAQLTAGADADVLRSLRGSAPLSAPVRERLELTVQPPGSVSYGSELPEMQLGETAGFRVLLAGADVDARTVSYSLTGAGTLSEPSGVTTSAGEEVFSFTATEPGDVTVTASFDGRTASISFTVTGVGVDVTPEVSSVTYGESVSFNAAVTGTGDTAVTWTATGGTVTASGLFTPAMASAGSVTATHASGAADTVAFAIVQNVSISISPDAVTLPPGGAQQFSATVMGADNPAVTWTATGGTVTAAGLFTASTAAGSASVTVTSNADPSKFASATVTIAAPTGAAYWDPRTSNAGIDVGANTSAFRPGEYGTSSCPYGGFSDRVKDNYATDSPSSWSGSGSCTTSSYVDGTPGITEVSTAAGSTTYTVSAGADGRVSSVTISGSADLSTYGYAGSTAFASAGASVPVYTVGSVAYSMSGSVTATSSCSDVGSSSYAYVDVGGTRWEAWLNGTDSPSGGGMLTNEMLIVQAGGYSNNYAIGRDEDPCTGSISFSVTLSFG